MATWWAAETQQLACRHQVSLLASTNPPRAALTTAATAIPSAPPVALVLLPHALHQGVHLLLAHVGEAHGHRLPPRHRARRLARVGGKHARRVKLVACRCEGIARWGGNDEVSKGMRQPRCCLHMNGEQASTGISHPDKSVGGSPQAGCCIGRLSLPSPLTAKRVLHAKHLHAAVEHADAAPVGVVVLRAWRGRGEAVRVGSLPAAEAVRFRAAAGRQADVIAAAVCSAADARRLHGTRLLQQVVDIQVDGRLAPLVAARPAAGEPLPLLHPCCWLLVAAKSPRCRVHLRLQVHEEGSHSNASAPGARAPPPLHCCRCCTGARARAVERRTITSSFFTHLPVGGRGPGSSAGGRANLLVVGSGLHELGFKQHNVDRLRAQ